MLKINDIEINNVDELKEIIEKDVSIIKEFVYKYEITKLLNMEHSKC